MRVFFKVPGPVLILLLTAAIFLCSCSLPGALPTVTPTPDQTEAPALPSPAPTSTPLPTETPVPEYLSVEPEALKGETVILRYSLDGRVRDTLADLVTRFNQENALGITVQAVPAYSMEELSAFMDGSISEATDLVIAGSAWLRSQNSSGAIAGLSEFMNDPELSFENGSISPIMPVMLAEEDLDGEYYALPLWAEPAFLFYNKTWAIELGFEDTPTDLAGFAEQACAAGKASYSEKEESKHGTGGWIVSSDPEDVMSWLLIFARDGQTPGEILRSENGDVFSDTAAWLRNLYDNGCAWNSRVKEPYDYFANRYALFYSGTYADAERQFNAFEQSSEHGFDNWDLVVYPARSVGKNADPRIYGDIVSAALLNGEAGKMNASWQFIRWLFEDQHAAELALSAGGWPVQDNDAVTKMYRNSGEDKLYQTLSYRQYLVNNDADENWLTDQLILSDGFAYIFNPSVNAEGIAGIWDQIGSSIAEVSAVSDTIEIEKTETTTAQGGNDEQ